MPKILLALLLLLISPLIGKIFKLETNLLIKACFYPTCQSHTLSLSTSIFVFVSQLFMESFDHHPYFMTEELDKRCNSEARGPQIDKKYKTYTPLKILA